MEGNALLWSREGPALNSVHRHSKLSGCLLLSLAEECAVPRSRTSRCGFGVSRCFQCPALLFSRREPLSLSTVWAGGRAAGARQSRARFGALWHHRPVRGSRGIPGCGSAFVAAVPALQLLRCRSRCPPTVQLVGLEEEQHRHRSRHRRQPVRSGSDIQGPSQDRNQQEIESLRRNLQALEKKYLDLTSQHSQDMSHYEKDIMKLRLELERGEALCRVLESEMSLARKDAQVQMHSAEDELWDTKAKLLELQARRSEPRQQTFTSGSEESFWFSFPPEENITSRGPAPDGDRDQHPADHHHLSRSCKE